MTTSDRDHWRAKWRARWRFFAADHPVGALVSGVVRFVEAYGLFVEVAPGVLGRVQIVDVSWIRSGEGWGFEVGDRMAARVLRVNVEADGPSLGLKQLIPDPWRSLARRWPTGSVASGEVASVRSYGVFFHVAGVVGLVHREGLDGRAWCVGDRGRVVLAAIDPAARKLTLRLASG